MANRSSIKANEEELKAHFADLAAQNLWPLWTLNQSKEPKSKATPYIWHWRDLRPPLRASSTGAEEARI
jgi:gentisate 1,2-dioxygenase